MFKYSSRTKRACQFSALAALALAMSSVVSAQDDADLALAAAGTLDENTTGRSFTAADFARFAPRNALDILNRVPGFAVTGGDDQDRGLGQASANVLINGQRLSSKSQNVFDQLRRITVDNVERIDIVDGATLDLPGLSGQAANIITRYGDISGRFEYRTMHRPKYAEPSWFGGELSASGSTPSLEWSLAYTHGSGRGAAGGPGFITDGSGAVTEWRDIYLHFEGEFPSLSSSLKWESEGGTIANLNAVYNRNYTDFSNDEERDQLLGVDSFRDFDNRSRGYGYEIGTDIDFKLGPGRLKLIGLERFNDSDVSQFSALIKADASPATGNRFASQSETGERIARAEYRWDMLGGNWEVDTEAAFNRLDQSSQLFNLDPGGNYVEIAFPNGRGEVTEDRYEMILTHGRNLTEDLTLQLGIGAENSELSQSGPGGLTRDFWRPKGSLSLAWAPRQGTDLSLNIARRVGQLSFGDFLASVSLALGNANAGNVQLKPTLTWESNLQVKQSLGPWGSGNLRFYSRWLDDYIDIIPIAGGGESRGNIDQAQLYGLNLNSTFNLDPLGLEGLRLDLNLTLEESQVDDPFTGMERSFSNHNDRRGDISLRHDVPGTDWAWGVGMEYTHVQPYYRSSELGRDYEGPVYTRMFVEHKDFFGLTANLQVFNLTDGRAIFKRTVHEGLRDRTAVVFNENRDLSVQPIFRLQITGNF